MGHILVRRCDLYSHRQNWRGLSTELNLSCSTDFVRRGMETLGSGIAKNLDERNCFFDSRLFTDRRSEYRLHV